MNKLIFITLPLLITSLYSNYNSSQINENTYLVNDSSFENLSIGDSSVSEVINYEILSLYYLEFQKNGYEAYLIDNEWVVESFQIVYSTIINYEPPLEMIYEWNYNQEYVSYKGNNSVTLFERLETSFIKQENYIYEDMLVFTVISFNQIRENF